MLAGGAIGFSIACVPAAPPAPTAASAAKPTAATAASPVAATAASPVAGSTPVLSVRQVPPGPPTPAIAAMAATPIAQKPPLPAMFNQPVGQYTLYAETIASAAPSQYGLIASPGCTIDSVFKRGMRMVWRFQIFDTSTGKMVSDRDGATAKIQLPQVGDVNAFFAPRGPTPPPPDAPWTWAAVWNVPPDYPLGAMPYAIALTTKDGKTTTIKPTDFGAMPPQIVD